MKLHRGLTPGYAPGQGSVATIGTFDGVHRGHRALLDQLVSEARARDLMAAVVTFEPHPREYFAEQRDVSPPARVTSLREKLVCFREAGVDLVWLLRFDSTLAALEAERFARAILVDGLQARAVLIGDDFRFGHRRAGDFALLQRLGEEHGFNVSAMGTVEDGDERIGSSRVRDALANGDFEFAARLLGRPWTVSARVTHGDRVGRRLGFPTANMPLKRRVFPVSGVVAVKVYGANLGPRLGVASIGTRPTVCGKRPLLEVHLFDHAENLYGRRLEVEFCLKLREEEHFESLDALTRAIEHDVARARAWFAEQQTRRENKTA